MATPVYITNWNHRIEPASVNGGGLYGVISGTVMSIDTTILSPQSLKCVTSSSQGYVGINQVSGSAVIVGRVFVYFPTSLPSTSMQFAIGNGTGIFINIRYDSSDGKFEIGNSDLWVESSVTALANTLYRFDFRMDVSGSTYLADWKIDGVDQPQWSRSGQTPTTWSNFRLGSQNVSSGTVLFQHLALSVTSGDYPLDSGSVVTECLLPSSDGTHNAGTNVIEDDTGVDIGVTPAYNKINTLPPGTSPYIRQAANGTTNYAEVLFSDLSMTPSNVLGGMAILGYTSETTTTNRGACIVSKDDFSSYTPVWGDPTTTVDYSDGSTSNVFWKSSVIAGLNDLTTANALKARLGYSGDANPDPYWMVLCVEVSYSVSASNDIELDLVTYSSNVPAVTILENEVVPLDLVTHVNTFHDITVTENVNIQLDQIVYSIVFPDISILENEVIPLDLVAYSSTILDITILENELVSLDLVTYSSTVPNITVLENIVEILDAVSYSSIVPDITILESISDPLDLVTYSLEVHSIELLESSDIGLDQVDYVTTVYDITIIESELVSLDLVPYSVIVYDLTILESSTISLDLVAYDIIVNDTVLFSPYDSMAVPLIRTYSIQRELRRFIVDREDRSMSVDKEDRTYSVS